MKAELLHILQHSLGLDRYGQGARYRNYFVAGGDDVTKCRELVALGYMQERPASELSGRSPVFVVTREGIEAVAQESPSPPKLTRGQRRYRAYLSSDTTETFIEWLRNSYWNDYRARLGA